MTKTQVNFGQARSALCQNVIEILSSDDEGDEGDQEKCNISKNEAPAVINTQSKLSSAKRKTQNITYKNSPYVQHLAEICHDILHDGRWKTIEDKNRLFQWQSGDDMSVLNAFDKLYIPMDNHGANDNTDDSVVGVSNPKCDQNARCIHLYSRLFHRKGPWFSLSDIFMRYYHRDYIKRKKYENISSVDDNDTTSDDDDDDYENCNDPTNHHNEEAPTHSKDITWLWIEDCLNDCFTDIHYLISNGFFRSFTSEDECGTVIGSHESFCTMKEKDGILRKLGGKSMSQKSFDYNFDDYTSNSTKKRKRIRRYHENEIFKQMKCQNTIFAKSRGCLPVKKHVNSTLLASFAQKLSVQANKYLNHQQDLKSNQKSIDEIISIIEQAWANVSLSLSNLPICFRLREEPLVTLRRCARIYLIAGNGPGNMRYDGTNAWLTVHEGSARDGASKELYESRSFANDICTIPDPPDASHWCKVDFIGLKYRLGLISCHFVNNYMRLSSANVSKYNDIISKMNVQINVFKDIQSFHIWELCIELRNMIDYLIQWNRLVLYAHRKKVANDSKNKPVEACPSMSNKFDFLSTQGRRKIINKFLGYLNQKRHIVIIHQRVEKTISLLFDEEDNEDAFITDAERNIFVCGLICQNVFLLSLKNLPTNEMMYLIYRPWLRHLCWRSVLAYLIWDCVDITEKRGYHLFALEMLEAIFHGYLRQDNGSRLSNSIKEAYVQVLLSRRVRGKVCDRMLLDEKHVMSKRKKGEKMHTSKKVKDQKNKLKRQYDERIISILKVLGTNASVPFSFLRKLSKRLRLSLSQALVDVWNIEMLELGIRLKHQLNEWLPPTDVSIANSISQESGPQAGYRCSYISNDLEDEMVESQRSITVEELAIQEYASGKLPCDGKLAKGGGWQGWHSEGVHIIALFRILVSNSLLQHDYNNCENQSSELLLLEQFTIFLSPYQSCPLDLHVGHSLLQISQTPAPIRSFYERRKRQIEDFLSDIKSSSPQQLSNLIHKSILHRRQNLINLGKPWENDQQLVRDLKQIRTLSLLAASFGGEILATMFRCLCFDYRHFCGGLPDLTLVRAGWNENDLGRFSDWNEWIGEEFKVAHDGHVKALLYDRDEEFLGGCLNEQKSLSTVKDKNNGFIRNKGDLVLDLRPLNLSHNDQQLFLQCMFVEVKSANDTLDERQEDWLNIIGRCGEARVCKFVSSIKKIK